MMAMVFELTYSGVTANPPRGWKTVRKNGYLDTGRAWHHRYAKRHFTNPGAKLYGYQKRKGQQFPFGSKAFLGSYTGKKWKKFKHTNPLVWSGDTRRDVLTKWRVQWRRAGYAQVIMNARGLNRRSRHSTINMRREMETVIPAEERTLATDLQKSIDRGMSQLKRTKKRRKRIGG